MKPPSFAASAAAVTTSDFSEANGPDGAVAGTGDLEHGGEPDARVRPRRQRGLVSLVGHVAIMARPERAEAWGTRRRLGSRALRQQCEVRPR